MESDKKQRVYKVIMLVVLTVFITAMITTIALYKSIGSQDNIKYIISGDSSGVAQRIAYYKKYIQEHYLYDINDEEMVIFE